MWRLKNSVNRQILAKFHKYLVAPMLTAMIESSRSGSSEVVFPGELGEQQREVLRLALEVGVKRDDGAIRDQVQRALGSMTTTQIIRVQRIYFGQRKDLRQGRYGIPGVSVPAEVNALFSKGLYESLFDNPEVCRALGVPNFNRAKFHSNLSEENGELAICPYCDLDTIIGPGNYVVEHFLPRNRYPLLALNAFNLFSACNACNKSEAGKGTRVVPTAGTPYFQEAGQHLCFQANHIEKTVGITVRDSLGCVEGFVELLKLRSRYASARTYNTAFNRFESLLDAVGYDGAKAIDYVDKTAPNSNLSYLLRDWLVAN